MLPCFSTSIVLLRKNVEMGSCNSLKGADRREAGAKDISKMSTAQARRALVAAFDQASKSSKSYLVKVALTLASEDREEGRPIAQCPERASPH